MEPLTLTCLPAQGDFFFFVEPLFLGGGVKGKDQLPNLPESVAGR